MKTHPDRKLKSFADGKKFTYRRNDQKINGITQECYEVYSRGLETWAFCFLESEAEIVANALEFFYDKSNEAP